MYFLPHGNTLYYSFIILLFLKKVNKNGNFFIKNIAFFVENNNPCTEIQGLQKRKSIISGSIFFQLESNIEISDPAFFVAGAVSSNGITAL